jgi:hypothetical protein
MRRHAASRIARGHTSPMLFRSPIANDGAAYIDDAVKGLARLRQIFVLTCKGRDRAGPAERALFSGRPKRQLGESATTSQARMVPVACLQGWRTGALGVLPRN